MTPNDRNKKGTGFTNLSRILQASRGARLGGQVASGVQQTGQQVRSQIGQAGQQFQQRSAEEAAKFNEEQAGQRNALIERIGSVTPTSGAEGVSQPEEDVLGRFENWRTTEYKGPKGLEDYGTLAGKVSEAEQLGRLGRTSGGKQELLRRFVGGRDYSQGEQKLDAALLGLTGQRELSEAQRATRGLGTELIKQAGSASEQAQELARKAKAFGEETVKGVLGKKEKILSDVEYGEGGKSLQQLFSEAKAKEEGRSKLAQDIRDFDAYYQGLISSGKATKDQQRDSFAKLLSQAQESGYISSDEVSRLLNTKSLSGSDYDPEYDLISRAQGLGLNPYESLAALTTSGAAARNLDLAGVVTAQAPERAKQLSLLEQLAGKTSEQTQFSPETKAYQSGTLGFEKGTPEFKLQVLSKEIPKFESDINKLNNDIGGIESVLNKEVYPYMTKKEAAELRAGLARNEAWAKERIINTANYEKGRRFMTNLMNSYENAYLNRDKLKSNLDKATKYKQRIEQNLASIDNPYAEQDDMQKVGINPPTKINLPITRG